MKMFGFEVTITEENLVRINQEGYLDDERTSVIFSPEQIPALIKWLKNATNEIKSNETTK